VDITTAAARLGRPEGGGCPRLVVILDEPNQPLLIGAVRQQMRAH
jgi:hypothetical protein